MSYNEIKLFSLDNNKSGAVMILSKEDMKKHVKFLIEQEINIIKDNFSSLDILTIKNEYVMTLLNIYHGIEHTETTILDSLEMYIQAYNDNQSDRTLSYELN
ncbi:hypothetical protein [Staphylococcus hominis]|uniref:hypothetical protein n=1 Tax=Staphylococcus hominis TaxID=1290 RepID=UPI00143EAB7A|nr:hypothetical protein [Staphylococcus hominis]QIY36028.1 hypothetical protein FOC53_00370 [Staphylococcus hominis]